MIVKHIKYTDYDGNVREEDFYFNLNKAEISEMELSEAGGYSKMLEKLQTSPDVPKIMAVFKDIILKSYGIKSDDGKRFIKSEQLSKEFTETEAYSELFMEIGSDPEKAKEFIVGILPADMRQQVAGEVKKLEEAK